MQDDFDDLFVPEVLDGLAAFAPATMRSDATHRPAVKRLNLGPDAADSEKYDKIPVVIWTRGYDTDPRRPPENPEASRWMISGDYQKDTWHRK